jgi:hypothetical protein
VPRLNRCPPPTSHATCPSPRSQCAVIAASAASPGLGRCLPKHNSQWPKLPALPLTTAFSQTGVPFAFLWTLNDSTRATQLMHRSLNRFFQAMYLEGSAVLAKQSINRKTGAAVSSREPVIPPRPALMRSHRLAIRYHALVRAKTNAFIQTQGAGQILGVNAQSGSGQSPCLEEVQAADEQRAA